MKKASIWLGSAVFLASGAAQAVEKSDLSVVSLHTGMTSLFDLSQNNIWVLLAGFTALAGTLAYRVVKNSRHARH